MKINVDQPLLTLDGQPVVEGGKPVLVKDVLLMACLASLETDRQQQGLAYRLYTLANLVHAGGELDIEAADAAFLQQRVEAVGFSPLAVGQLTDLLNARGGPTSSQAPVQPLATRPRHLAEAVRA